MTRLHTAMAVAQLLLLAAGAAVLCGVLLVVVVAVKVMAWVRR